MVENREQVLGLQQRALGFCGLSGIPAQALYEAVSLSMAGFCLRDQTLCGIEHVFCGSRHSFLLSLEV